MIHADYQHTCLLCNSAQLSSFTGFKDLPRVTSDCKPFKEGGGLFYCNDCCHIQKVANPLWNEEITKIYNEYDIYNQSKDGEEQAIFNQETGEKNTRSDILVKNLSKYINRGEGDILDIGCGNGTFLKSWGKFYPEWKLHGFDLDDRKAEMLKRITNFEKQFSGDLSLVDKKFDLIVMIHTLEHIPTPKVILNQIKDLLNPGGQLFIQVPNSMVWNFDYLIADHISHFSSITLNKFLNRMGYTVEVCSDSWINKELSILTCSNVINETQSDDSHQTPTQETIKEIVIRNMNWVKQSVLDLKELSKDGPIGIFGSSISAAWVSGFLDERISFYVDEDDNRIGNALLGKDIIHPDQVPAGSKVYIPLIPSISRNVKKRLTTMEISYHYTEE